MALIGSDVAAREPEVRHGPRLPSAGERLRLAECERFEQRFHSMIVKLPTAAG